MSTDHFPNDSKPVDIAVRAFHRINSPNYDTAVDTSATRRGAKVGPTGFARDSGARGPDAFKDSGFLAKVTQLLAKLAKNGLRTVPGANFIPFLDDLIGKLTGTPPLEALTAALGKLLSAAVEGALFARFMRSIPAWVPIGRKGYDNTQFTYVEDGTARQSSKEEEREVEGRLSGSYMLSNDIVFSQWDHLRHWAFQVLPAPGFRYLIGNGNVGDADEDKFIQQIESRSQDQKFRPVLNIYGQGTRANASDKGAIECLMDIGAISKPLADGGTHGVMFSPEWPYWPMAGDHFWATGRWAYDCMRAVPSGKTEIFSTQINPIKAFAASRFEGFQFPENTKVVPATRFFFFATSEGGYTEFHTTVDRNTKTQTSGIALDDRNYEFVVDLPPRTGDASPYPIGATINFAFNRLVLRPRLLIVIKQAPFGVPTERLSDKLTFVAIEPVIDILRPDDPTKHPTQARITIPLTSLPKPRDPKNGRAVGVDIALGWHDPAEVDAKTLFKVQVQIRQPLFFSQGGPARLATAINGRWSLLAENVRTTGSEPTQNLPPTPTRIIHEAVMFLKADAPVSVVSSGTWLHGFGEVIEREALLTRQLKVGGALLNVNNDTKRRIQKFIDDARKTIADLRKTADNVKEPKKLLKAELQKKLDELKRNNADSQAIDALQKQINSLVDGLPDTPEALKNALGGLNVRLGELSDGLGALEDFLKITDDLIGEPYTPGWHEDIDAAIKKDLEESKRVSAIARSMFLHPTPIVNKSDEPMGWAEFVDVLRTPIDRPTMGNSTLISPLGSANVAKLFGTQQSLAPAPLRFRLIANQFTIVGSGNNLAERINHPAESADYAFEVNVVITPQT